MEYIEVGEGPRAWFESLSQRSTHEQHHGFVESQYSATDLQNFETLLWAGVRSNPRGWKNFLENMDLRLHQKAIELPGSSEPYLVRSDRGALEILNSPFEGWTRFEKTAALQSLLIDTAWLPDGESAFTPLQILLRAHGLSSDFDFKLGVEISDPEHLLFVVASRKDFWDVLNFLRDSVSLNGMGYTATDPDEHRSLVLLNEFALPTSFVSYLLVGVHELSHVLQHRYGETHQLALTDGNNGMNGLRVAMLEGLAHETTFASFQKMEELLRKANSDKKFGYDLLASQNYLSLFDPQTEAEKRKGTLLAQIIRKSHRESFSSPQEAPWLLPYLRVAKDDWSLGSLLAMASNFPQYLGRTLDRPESSLALFFEEQNSKKLIEDLESQLARLGSQELEAELMALIKLYMNTNRAPNFKQRLINSNSEKKKPF